MRHVTVPHLAALLSSAAAEDGDRLALVDTGSGRRITWCELDREVDAVARGFNAVGLVSGYRVGIGLVNRVEAVTCYLGALRAGLVAVPLDPRLRTGELVRRLADCGARVLLADRTSLTSARQAVAGLEDALAVADDDLRRTTAVPRIVTVGAPGLPGELSYGDVVTADGTDAPVSGDPERLAVLLYPRGAGPDLRAAMLTHRALLAHIEQAAAVQPPMLTPDDVVLGILPMSHVYGLNAVLGHVLRRRSRLVLADGFDPEATLDLVGAEGVTVLPVAPTVLEHWRARDDLDERLRGVRLVLSGSAPLSGELVRELTARTGVEVHQGYGLTEAAPGVTSTLCSDRSPVDLALVGSVGAALPGVEIRLLDPSGRVVEGQDAGEVSVRGANLFSGYWPDGAGGPDADGWFPTGDVGLLDDRGDLVLLDRLGELVVVAGFTVFPTEVVDVLTELDEVAEAAVRGADDPATGQAVVAYVTPAAGTPHDAEALVDLVREHCASRLARFKQPRDVHVVDRLPGVAPGEPPRRLRAPGRRRAGLLG
jgi:long-chain acyl-CoA synthetase